MRAAVYARLSRSDPNDRQGVEWQLTKGREHAESLGWTVKAEFSDNDRTAFKQRHREGFTALCEAIRDGSVDGVVFQHQDRLARNTRIWGEFLDLAAEYDIGLEAWAGAPVDPKTATGRYQTKIQAATDEHYSAVLSEKIKSAHARIAATGMPNGGRRPFGYLKGGMEPDPVEAPVVRQMYEKFLAGQPIRSLARGLNDQGFKTAGGNSWRAVRVRDVLANPRYAGLRVHRGEIVGEAAWEPLVGREVWEQVDGILRSRRREGYDGRRTYLLTGGLAVCGKCGHNLESRPQRGHRGYQCPPSTAPNPGCGGVYSIAEPFEQLVAEAVIHLVDTSDVLARLRREPDQDAIAKIRLELAAKETATEELAVEYFSNRSLGRREYFAARNQLHEEIDRLRIALADEATNPDPSSLVNGKPVGESWTEWDLDRRRALISAVLESVELGPAVQGRNFFDPERVSLVWRA